MLKHNITNPLGTLGLGLTMAVALAACGTEPGPISSSSVSTSSSSVPSSSSSVASSSSSVDTIGSMPLVVAIDAGNLTGSTTLDGTVYQADKYSVGGSANSTTDTISGASSGALYQTERYGAFTYEVPVTASGYYTIELHFAEIYLESAGERSFSVTIEGNTELNNIDLYSLAGHDGAYSYVADDVQVSDGAVTIKLVAGVENPTIAAFAIYSYDGELDTTAPVTPVTPVIPTGEKFVGNITTGGNIGSDFGQYWNQITPENEGKWGSVEGTRDSYNWAPIDRIYNYSRQNGIPMKAHTLVWGSQMPNWINGLSSAEQAAEIEEWIRDYCTRYPDTEIIDVVNEAHPNHAPANYAQSAFGNNWITKSFQLARQYCPNSILVYNDFNFMTWDTDPIMELIRPAIQAGVVDAVGLQAHSLYDPKVWSAAEIKGKLDLISTLGVPIYISEYDIEATDDQTQLQYMQMHFPVFYEHPNVIGVTFWGYIYGSTWRTGTGLIRNGQPRPALTWLLQYLGR